MIASPAVPLPESGVTPLAQFQHEQQADQTRKIGSEISAEGGIALQCTSD